MIVDLSNTRYLTKPIKQKIMEKLCKNNFDNGCRCVYIKWCERYGIKLYLSKSVRDETYSNQKFLYSFGMAPKANMKFTFPFLSLNVDNDSDGYYLGELKKINLYGYITEHVSRKANPKNKTHQKMFLKFVNTIEQMGFPSEDYWTHHGDPSTMRVDNIRLKGNKIICIDCGPESLNWV